MGRRGLLRMDTKLIVLLAVCCVLVCSAEQHARVRLANTKQCGPHETQCPDGCCPEENWVCCCCNMYCAATAADCPSVEEVVEMMEVVEVLGDPLPGDWVLLLP